MTTQEKVGLVGWKLLDFHEEIGCPAGGGVGMHLVVLVILKPVHPDG